MPIPVDGQSNLTEHLAVLPGNLCNWLLLFSNLVDMVEGHSVVLPITIQVQLKSPDLGIYCQVVGMTRLDWTSLVGS